MKKYSLAYDRVFLAYSKQGEKLIINGETISDVSVCVRVNITNKQTDETLYFTCSDDEQPTEQLFEGHTLSEFFRADYDREYGLLINPTDICRQYQDRYRISFFVEPELCCKGVENRPCISDSTPISMNECISILKDYPEYFDTTDNKPAQCCAYAPLLIGQMIQGKKMMYLVSTNNEILQERINSGEILEGMLSIDEKLCEAVFEMENRLAIQFESYGRSDNEITLTSNTNYYVFSDIQPKTVIGG